MFDPSRMRIGVAGGSRAEDVSKGDALMKRQWHAPWSLAVSTPLFHHGRALITIISSQTDSPTPASSTKDTAPVTVIVTRIASPHSCQHAHRANHSLITERNDNRHRNTSCLFYNSKGSNHLLASCGNLVLDTADLCSCSTIDFILDARGHANPIDGKLNISNSLSNQYSNLDVHQLLRD
jgi:hypothetical protein